MKLFAILFMLFSLTSEAQLPDPEVIGGLMCEGSITLKSIGETQNIQVMILDYKVTDPDAASAEYYSTFDMDWSLGKNHFSTLSSSVNTAETRDKFPAEKNGMIYDNEFFDNAVDGVLAEINYVGGFSPLAAQEGAKIKNYSFFFFGGPDYKSEDDIWVGKISCQQ